MLGVGRHAGVLVRCSDRPADDACMRSNCLGFKE